MAYGVLEDRHGVLEGRHDIWSMVHAGTKVDIKPINWI